MIKVIKPVISEKSMLNATNNKYTFLVHPEANKAQIAQDIANLYKVEVIAVNILRSKRIERLVRGRFKSRSKMEKKAIVTLKKGQKIDGYEVKE